MPVRLETAGARSVNIESDKAIGATEIPLLSTPDMTADGVVRQS